MNNRFQTGKANFGRGIRNFILIPLKPSQIPRHIDQKMMHAGCIGHLDGPNNRVIYEFFWEDGFETAKQYLNKYGWNCS